MAKARTEVELIVRLGSESSPVEPILALVAQKNVNVLAYCVYSDPAHRVLLLVTDDAVTAKSTLASNGYQCRADSVVLVDSSVQLGGAALVGARLGYAGIRILYSYTCPAEGSGYKTVFKTNDNHRALEILAASENARRL